MNSMQRMVGVLMALVLAAFALPAVAATDKIYTLNMSPSSLTAGQPTQSIRADFANTSPGNSTIKSLKLFAPQGITIKPGATLGNGYVGIVVVASDGGSVSVDAISPPIKLGQLAMPINMTVDVSCSATTGNWTTVSGNPPKEQVWTGSGFSGQNFSLVPPSTTQTQITGTCAVSVNTSANPTEGGSVSCGVAVYNATTSCTAQPTGGWKFTGWASSSTAGGTCAGATNPCTTQTLTSSTPYTLVGNFTKYSVTAGVSPDPSGTVSCSESATTPGQYTCTASKDADNKWGFKSWSSPSACTSVTSSSCTFTATADTTVTAVFGQFTIATAVNPSGTGSISCSPNPVGYGLNATCTATPFTNYSFADFSGDCTGLTCTLSNVTSAKSVTANFKSATLGCANTNNLVSSPGTAYDPNADVSFIGSAGWGLRRGANTDNTLGTTGGTACNELVDVAVTQVGNSWKVISDKTDVATATYYYVFVGSKVQVDLNGYSAKRPWLSWGVANPSATFSAPDWVPALMCNKDPVDLTTMTAAELFALLPTIPNVDPFNDTAKYPPATRPQYQPGVVAKACVSQQGSTSIIYELQDPTQPFNATTNPYVTKVQFWHKVVDEVDLSFGYE